MPPLVLRVCADNFQKYNLNGLGDIYLKVRRPFYQNCEIRKSKSNFQESIMQLVGRPIQGSYIILESSYIDS